MKTALAFALTTLGVAQLFAGPQREASPAMTVPRQPAISYPQVELQPPVAREPRVVRSAEPPPPAQERREQSQAKREDTRRQQQDTTPQDRLSFSEARAQMPRERHDRAWWDQRYKNIVRAGTGYYFLDAGYWYPAFGYDPGVDTYAYDGPIYATADLTPDEEITTVQKTMQAIGYYNGSITGVLDRTTLEAITDFQTANGLVVTGALDQPTLETLGLF